MNVERYASRPEWLAHRGIGGSSVAAIRGRSPYGDAWDVWLERQPETDRDSSSIVQDEGARFEPYLLAEYSARTGRPVESAGDGHLIVRHPQFPWATASPDGLVPTIAEPQGGLEVKTDRTGFPWADDVTIDAWSPDADAQVPPYYLDQVYWYLEVTGLPWWDIAGWIPQPWGFPKLHIVRVMADAAHQRRMLLDAARWRHRHLVLGHPPPPSPGGACRSWYNRTVPEDKEVAEATVAEAELVAELVAARADRSVADRRAKEAEAKLAEAMGSRYGLKVGDAKVLWIASKGRESADMDIVRAMCPQAIRPGRPFRSFRLYNFEEG